MDCPYKYIGFFSSSCTASGSKESINSTHRKTYCDAKDQFIHCPRYDEAQRLEIRNKNK